LTRLTELDLSYNGLTIDFGQASADEAITIFPKSLKTINLAKNKLCHVPTFVYLLPILETCDLSGN